MDKYRSHSGVLICMASVIQMYECMEGVCVSCQLLSPPPAASTVRAQRMTPFVSIASRAVTRTTKFSLSDMIGKSTYRLLVCVRQ